ncbi:MAG: SusC/RagA family TonB-linked outer membrane protein [Cyclobacteriaceae bacterium]
MRKFLLLCFSLCFVLTAVAQERVISGKVTSKEDGASSPGVNVVVKGTTLGTVTDADGNYTLSVPSGARTLTFTFIGYKTVDVEIGSQTTVSVSLETDITQLNEVVVSGLGWQAETRTLGYSVANVKSEMLNQAKALNVFTGLSGKVAGLQIRTTGNGINPSTRVTLRGNRSLTGNNQALVVLDGIIVPSNTLNSINNNDIENVTILKGASAAAIYGSDAANGVLLITLKKGTGKTPEITFSNTTQLESVSYLPSFQTGWGAGTNAYSRGYIPYENQSYGPAFDGSTVDLGRTREDGTIQKGVYSAKPDAKRDIWDTGVTQQNYLSFSAGDDDSRFDMSLQNVSQTGVVPGDKYTRTGGRFAGSQKVGKFQGSFSALYNATQTDQNANFGLNNNGSTFTNVGGNGFYFDVVNTAANIDLASYRNWRNFKNADGSLNDANPNNYFNDYYANPWVGLDAYRAKSTGSEFTGNAQISFKATDWLNLTYRAGLTSNSSFGKATSEVFNYRDYAAKNIYIARANVPGYTGDNSFNQRRIQSDFFASFNKTFSKLDVQLILGTQVTDDLTKGVNVASTNLVVPGVYNVSNRTGEPIASEVNFNTRKFGIFTDFSVTYNNFVTLHFAGRNDQTSLLAKGNNTYFYPAVDMAFVVTDAFPALGKGRILNFAKLTAGYARVGQVTVLPYSLEPVFNQGGGFPYGGRAGFSIGNTLPDGNLKPEFTTNLEFSGDFKLWENKIGLNVTYYKQNSTNQTVNIATSSATGYTGATINAGEIENSGLEVEIDAKLIKAANGFELGANLNYANRSTSVVSLYQGLDELNLGNNIFAAVGQQYPIVKVDAYKKDNQGRVIVDAKTGYPLNNSTGLVNGGQTEPKHVFGISPYLKFKGLRLDITAEYRTGNVIWNNSGETMTFTGVSKISDSYGRERFVYPNSVIETVNSDGSSTYTPNTSVAVEDGGLGFWDNHFDDVSQNFVTSAAFWKVREVSLSYTLPKSLLAKTKVLKRASVSLVGRNLLMFLPSSNLYTDPEFNLGTGNAVGVNSISITPPTRTYGINVDLTF